MNPFAWIGRRFGLGERKGDRAAWLYFGGADSYAGKTVTPESAMQVDTFFACVRMISSTIGSLPLTVAERQEDGGRITRRDHPLYSILHDQPNADQTAMEFVEGLVAHLCLWGNAFAEKTVSAGQVRALTLLRPDAMTVYRNQAGELRYRYTDTTGVRELTEEQVFHVRGFGLGNDVGLSPLAYARQSVGTAIAADEAAGRTFSRGLKPSGFFVSPEVLDAEQREQARERLVKPFEGSANTGYVDILEGNFKFESVTIQPRDAELLLSRRFSVESVCRAMGVPPILVGHASEGVSNWGSGIAEIVRGWHTLGLRPYLVRIEQAVRQQLIAPGERGRIYAEFNIEGLLRADPDARATFYSKMVQNGIFSRNDCRVKEGLQKVDGGDILTAQTNLAPLDQLGATDPRAAMRNVLGLEDSQ